MRSAAVFSMFAAVACGDTYVVVTVTAQPGVLGATALDVVATEAGSAHRVSLALGAHAFPVTFSVGAAGASGELDLAVSAVGSDGTLVGLGSASTQLGAGGVALTLAPADFVVNTDDSADQFLTADYETNGFQLAATEGGPWTVAFRETCADCQIFARMFDPTGVPVKTTVAASTNEFALTSATTSDQANPAVAAAGAATLAVWDFTDPTAAATGVACRGIDAAGGLTAPGQLALSTDAADAVTVAALSTGDFAVAWETMTPVVAIRTVVAKADCSLVGAVATASTIVGASDGPHRASIAANGESVLYTWITDAALHVRTGTPSGAFSGADTLLYGVQAPYAILEARAAPMGAGFGIAIRLATTDGTTAGVIQLLLVNAAGQLLAGAPTLISDQTGADFSVGAQGFGIATRADGATLIAWQQCDDGRAGMCTGHQDIYGQLVRATGELAGAPFEIPTTTAGDQTAPSVAALGSAFAVAWTDGSKAAPDTAGTAVRARVIYPTF